MYRRYRRTFAPTEQTRNSPVHSGCAGGQFECTVQANESNHNVTKSRFPVSSVKTDGLEEHAEGRQDNTNCRECGGQFRSCNTRKQLSVMSVTRTWANSVRRCLGAKLALLNYGVQGALLFAPVCRLLVVWKEKIPKYIKVAIFRAPAR